MPACRRRTLGLFYIKNRNQTTTIERGVGEKRRLFYIKNRNQTTTRSTRIMFMYRLFYIKNRNQTTTVVVFISKSIRLFYIKNRNQTTTPCVIDLIRFNYFTSKIEIKPQLLLCFALSLLIILHQK